MKFFSRNKKDDKVTREELERGIRLMAARGELSPIGATNLIRAFTGQGQGRYLQGIVKGAIWGEDSSGNFGLYSSDGLTELAHFDSTGTLIGAGVATDSWEIKDDASDYLGIYSLESGSAVERLSIQDPGTGDVAINAVGGGRLQLGLSGTASVDVGNVGLGVRFLQPSTFFTVYAGINTVGIGVSAMRGIDDRADIAATDGAPITVYAVPVGATGKVRISATVVGSSGTVTSAIYTIKYTVDGVVVTDTVSISAVDTDASLSILVAPDASTNITAQLTTLAGAGANVDLTCLVEGVSAGM